jgi:NAD(P)-dependent dehydrogenase (short-subunit alcohol dehydrogenase family)
MSATRPFAIVTGSSTGIGFELAKRCAKERYDLLIVAPYETALAVAAKAVHALARERCMTISGPPADFPNFVLLTVPRRSTRHSILTSLGRKIQLLRGSCDTHPPRRTKFAFSPAFVVQ